MIRLGGKDTVNLLGVRRLGRRVEVFVNDVSVLGPADLGWSGPVNILLGVAAEVPNVRAEFERIDISAP
jgi:hypothetical protein